jgi:hypothetical protein
MTVAIEDLRAMSGKRVRIRFQDGHVVLGRIMAVDRDEPGEVIYEVLQVEVIGPPSLASVKPGTVASADAGLVVECSLADA